MRTRKVIAAIDNTPAARSVLAAGRALSHLLDAKLVAFHVLEDGGGTPKAAAETAGVPIEVAEGEVLELLLAAGIPRSVVVLVVGSKSTPLRPKPMGHVAEHLLTRVRKPLVVVPPVISGQYSIERMLCPLDGTSASARAVRSTVERACAGDVDVTVLHVQDESTLPMFEDHPEHELDAWAEEFMGRNCPTTPQAELEVRVGSPAEQILRVAEEKKDDLIVLSWAQSYSEERAAVVREVLHRSTVPIMLVPQA